ncbi:MFS transporter [Salinigranum rubrum]|uniref:MFS transporter n=1 Tax=Salinigranum rubrum TaxID=755307 RepID=A0A2I8VLS3_9EURY|nr:MFS transporter [Salinigranum rubrum]AUV82887.1 MFS transporter [Salinigranum rubrum]
MFDVGDGATSVSKQTAVVVGLISGSQFVNHAFLVLLPPILPILSTDLNVSISMLGLAMGVQALVNTAFQLPFGYLADNYDRSIALGLSSVLGAVGAFIVALAPGFPELVVGQVVLGIGVAGHHAAHYPLLTDATTSDTRGRAFAVYNFGGSLGFATPPVVFTVAIAVVGLTWRHAIGLLAAVGLVYAVVVTAVVAWRVDDDVSAPNVDTSRSSADESLTHRVRAELGTLLGDRGILAVALLTLLASTANWGLTSYTVVFLTDGYDLSLSAANLVLTGLFVVGAGSILVGGYLTDHFGGGRVLVVSYVGLTALLVLIAAQVVPALVVIGLFLVLGGVRSIAIPARDELTERLATGDTIAKSFAIVTIGIMLGNAIAPPVFGYLIQWFGVQATFGAIAAVALGATAVTVLAVTRFAPERRSAASEG